MRGAQEEVQAMKEEKDEGRKGDMQVTPLYNNTFSCQGHRNVLKLQV